MKKFVTLSCALLLAGGLAFAQEQEKKTIEVTGEDELQQEKGRFQLTFVHPNADITRYNKIYTWDPVYQFRDVGKGREVTSTTSLLQTGQGPFAVRTDDQQKFEELVNKAMLKELGRSKKFEVVDQIAPGTLLLRSAFLDITSRVPPSRAGIVDVHLTTVGEATMVFELIDAETGVIQARVGERRLIQPPSSMYQVGAMPSNSATIWAEVDMWASDVARDLRVALDKAKKKAGKE